MIKSQILFLRIFLTGMATSAFLINLFSVNSTGIGLIGVTCMVLVIILNFYKEVFNQ